jgi:hypothetical protein
MLGDILPFPEVELRHAEHRPSIAFPEEGSNVLLEADRGCLPGDGVPVLRDR